MQTRIANAKAGAGLPIKPHAHPDGRTHKAEVEAHVHARRRHSRSPTMAAVQTAGPGANRPPVEFQVIRASDFICFDAEEHLNFAESKRVLQELALACRKRGLDRAMVDLRDLPVPPRPRFTNAELASLAGAFRAGGFGLRQRLAVLHSHDVHGTIRSFISICRKRGLEAAAFHEYDKAMYWLGKSKENPVELNHGTEVPIVRKNKNVSHMAGRKRIHRPTRRA